MEPPRRHRHLVVAPIAVLLLVVSLIGTGGEGTFQGQVLSNDGRVSLFPSGAIVAVDGGEGIEGETLLGGRALIVSEGLGEIHVGNALLRGFDGAFYVVFQNGESTIVALSTPVLVTVGERTVLVPVGTQWKWNVPDEPPFLEAGIAAWQAARSVLATPQRFAERELQRSVELRKTYRSDFHLPDVRTEPPAPLWEAPFQLEATRERAFEQWNAAVLGAVRGAVESDDAVALASLLHDPAYADALQTDASPTVALLLLARLEKRTPVTTLLLQMVADDRDAALLLSVHPRWSERVIGLDSFDVAAKRSMLHIFAFPLTQHSFAPMRMERWVDDAVLAIRESTDPAATLQTLVTASVPAVDWAERSGYPERARVTARSIAAIAAVFPELTTPEIQDLLESFRSLEHIPVVEDPPEEAVSSQENIPVVIVGPTFTPEQAEQQTYTLLQKMGALFTVETTIKSVEPDTADVQGIVFSGKSGDHILSFRYHLVSKQITDIVVGGAKYPYGLGLEAFDSWVRK